MPASRRFERTLGNDFKEAAEARVWLADCLQCLPADARGIVSDLVLVLGELLTNSVRHAYDREAPGRIDIVLSVGDEDVLLTVRDYGRPMDPTKRHEPDLTQANEGGYGLYLVRMLTDDLEIDAPGGVGNRVVVRRGIPAAAGARPTRGQQSA